MPVDPNNFLQYDFDAVRYAFQYPNPHVPHPIPDANFEARKPFEIPPLKKGEKAKKDLKKNQEERKKDSES